MQKYQSIQVLRAVAVIPVVFFHFSTFQLGRAGVDLFFCISGFVMAGQMDRSPAQFAWDRFTRIYPPFLAAMVLLFLVKAPAFDALTFYRSLVLWPNPKAVYLYPAWSLGYEAIFYASCVAAMFLSWRAVLAFFALAFLARQPYVGSAFVLEFLAGFAIARKAWLALPLLLLGAAVDHRVLSYGPVAAFILWLAVTNERVFQHRLWRPVALIGDASYAIYLTHVSVGYILPNHSPLLFVVWLCLAVGFAFHLGIEKPLMKIARKTIHSREREFRQSTSQRRLASAISPVALTPARRSTSSSALSGATSTSGFTPTASHPSPVSGSNVRPNGMNATKPLPICRNMP